MFQKFLKARCHDNNCCHFRVTEFCFHSALFMLFKVRRKTCELPSFLSRERTRGEHAGFQEIFSARAPDFPANVTTSTTWVAMVWQHLARISESQLNMKNKQRRIKTGFSVSRLFEFCVVDSTSGTSEHQKFYHMQEFVASQPASKGSATLSHFHKIHSFSRTHAAQHCAS